MWIWEEDICVGSGELEEGNMGWDMIIYPCIYEIPQE